MRVRFIRLRQIGPNHCSNDTLCLSFFDVFDPEAAGPFTVAPPRPPPPPPPPRLAGRFRVRHSSSGRFLRAGSERWNDLAHALEFGDEGDIFAAEDDIDWTRVFADRLCWFVQNSSSESPFGLDPTEDRPDSYTQFKFENGYVWELQNDRVLTVGDDGRAWMMKPRESRDGQIFEIVMVEEPKDLKPFGGFPAEFQVRQRRSGKYLTAVAGSHRVDDLPYRFAWTDVGDTFAPENNRKWTHVSGRGGLVWFVLSANGRSQIGLQKKKGHESRPFVHFRCDGYNIFERQQNRVLTEIDSAAFVDALDRTRDLGIELVPTGEALAALSAPPVKIEFVREGASSEVLV
jgi:hypothetical protein